jgi:hypothetical protein
MPIAATIAFPVFVFLLPLLILLLLVPGSSSTDEVSLLLALLPILMPLSSVMWFTVLHRLYAHRRSRHFHQFLLFLVTAIPMFLMTRLGTYRIG